MASFIDGPAAGTNLLLRRAPLFLRSVRDAGGRWDALDQLDDEPRPGESITVYRRQGESTQIHICARGRGSISGWYADADYVVVAVQPAGDVVSSTAAWRVWCTDHAAVPLATTSAPR